ncbi:MAG: cupin domain-containing protein [Acetobacteraceae bacterium]
MSTPTISSEVLPTGNERENEWQEVTPGERFRICTSSNDTNGAYLVFEVVADPRNGVPLHVHDNEEETFVVVEGTARMANGGQILDVATGMAVTIRRGAPHAWCNLSDSPLRMLVIFVPGRIEGLFRAASRADFDPTTIPAEYGTRVIGPALHDDIYSILSPRPSVSAA